MPPIDLVHRNVPLPPSAGGGSQLIDFNPWAFPPISSIAIDVVDVRTVNAGATATFAIVNTDVAQAVLRFWGNESTAFAGYADLRWTILINGLPHSPYVTMQESRGFISNPDPILIYLGRSKLVEVQVVNLSGVNNWEAKTRVKGWIFV